MIRVLVAGHRGRTGSEIVRALEAAPDIELVGLAGSGDDLPALLSTASPQAVVDFTTPAAALAGGLAAVAAGAAPVIGTSGLAEAEVDQLEAACRERGLGGMVAPNFAIGAVLMIRLAELAAPFFEAAEIVEGHREGKLDAPSATAMATARRLAAARGDRPFARPATETVSLAGARGAEVEGIGIHALRMPGLVADQAVLLGLPGQILAISHRTTGREAYAPGVLLAIRSVIADPRFHRSLDGLLGPAG